MVSMQVIWRMGLRSSCRFRDDRRPCGGLVKRRWAARSRPTWLGRPGRHLVITRLVLRVARGNEMGVPAHYRGVGRSRDGILYPPGLGRILSGAGIGTVRSAVRAPRMNAVMERWIAGRPGSCPTTPTPARPAPCG